jgi:hypothetical protein
MLVISLDSSLSWMRNHCMQTLFAFDRLFRWLSWIGLFVVASARQPFSWDRLYADDRYTHINRFSHPRVLDSKIKAMPDRDQILCLQG